MIRDTNKYQLRTPCIRGGGGEAALWMSLLLHVSFCLSFKKKLQNVNSICLAHCCDTGAEHIYGGA